MCPGKVGTAGKARRRVSRIRGSRNVMDKDKDTSFTWLGALNVSLFCAVDSHYKGMN